MLIPDLQNPFYVDVVHGIEHAYTGILYAFIMAKFSQGESKEWFYLDLMVSESVNGLIVAPAYEEDKKVKALFASGFPLYELTVS